MKPTRALRRIPALLCLVLLTVGSLPALAQRGGPTATPLQNPDMQLQDQLIRAGSLGANDLRSCDRFLSRATSPLTQTRFVVRTLNGRLEVNASQNPGGPQYTSCLEVVMGNAILQAAQSLGQTVPYNSNPVAVDVPMPFAGQGAVPPQNPQPVYVPTQPQPQPVYVPPQPVAQVQYSPVFQEPGRFVVRNVRLAGQGPSITVSNGGVVEGTMEIQHNCPGCGGAINQVIVGLGGEAQAQQCVWNGGSHSRGFETVRFQLVIPNQPGTYEVRVRYAQAYSCQQGALGWWRVDRPAGPDARSNIGVVIVQPQSPPPVVVQPQPTQPPPQQGGNLLFDGGFEQQRLAPGTWQVLSALPGWQLASGPGIELQNNVAGRAAEGAQFVELDSHSSSAIYQDVQTVPGQHYDLRLAFSARPGTPRVDNSVAVVLNGQVVSTLEAEGSHLSDTQWSYQTIRFQATGNSTRIELRHVGRSNGLGGYVDDVSLIAVDGRGPGRGRGRGRWR